MAPRRSKADTPRYRTNVYLEAAQVAALQKLTEETRVPWAEYIREGVDMVLAKYAKRSRKTHT